MLCQAPRDAEHPTAAMLVNLLSTPGWRFRMAYLGAVLFPDHGHLQQLYAGRHVGWQVAAHAVRAGRAIGRVIRPTPNVVGV